MLTLRTNKIIKEFEKDSNSISLCRKILELSDEFLEINQLVKKETEKLILIALADLENFLKEECGEMSDKEIDLLAEKNLYKHATNKERAVKAACVAIKHHRENGCAGIFDNSDLTVAMCLASKNHYLEIEDEEKDYEKLWQKQHEEADKIRKIWIKTLSKF